jgi:ABC-2 type transport system permease protein
MADNTVSEPVAIGHAPQGIGQALRSALSTIRRVGRLWRMYAALDLAFLIADLKLACIYIGADLLTSIAAVAGVLMLAERFAGIGPWSQIEVTFLLGYASTVGGIVNTFFGYNVAMISRRIGRGQLDHTLVQPQSIAVSLLTEGFTPFSGSAMLLTGMGLLGWAMLKIPATHTAGGLALLALNLLASSVAALSFSFIWGSLAFWAPRATEEISSSASRLLDQLKTFPLDGVGAILLGSLMTMVPVGFVAWYPSRALLGIDQAPWAVWGTPLAALLLAAITAFLFQKGIQHYARTGSQRYSSLGHRG